MILDLLFPRKCILCGKLLEKEELDLCRDCRVNAPECPIAKQKLPYLDSWVAVWYYEDTARESLLRYKFHGNRAYAPGYGRLLAMKLQREFPDGFDLVTWVPISSLRKLKRGFDQVELLAKYVARELGQPPVKTLRKIRHNRPQSGIADRSHRQSNVLGAYRLTDPALVRDKRILLLDDIITTGATAGEAARLLLTAGAREVHFGAVAAARHNAKK